MHDEDDDDDDDDDAATCSHYIALYNDAVDVSIDVSVASASSVALAAKILSRGKLLAVPQRRR